MAWQEIKKQSYLLCEVSHLSFLFKLMVLPQSQSDRATVPKSKRQKDFKDMKKENKTELSYFRPHLLNNFSA